MEKGYVTQIKPHKSHQKWIKEDLLGLWNQIKSFQFVELSISHFFFVTNVG